MKSLAYGIQEFSDLINGDNIYVDKTELIHKLISTRYNFLSRPRRFGKSLLLNTIKEIFLGNRELFKDLWIYDKIDWKPYPVIKISFSNIPYKTIGLRDAIDDELDRIARQHNIQFREGLRGSKFREIIELLGKESGCAD